MPLLDKLKYPVQITPAVKQTFILSASNAGARFMGMVFFIILARSLSVSEYGVFRYLLTLSTIYALIVVGVPTALTKFLGDRGSDPALKTEYLSNSLFLVSILFLALSAIVFLFAPHKILLILFIFAYLVDQFYIGFARGILDYFKLNGFKLLENIIQVVILFAVFLIYKQVNLGFSVIFYSISGLLSLAVFELIKPNFNIKWRYSPERIREIVRYALPVAFGAVGWTLLYGISNVYIERFHGPEQVGYFSVGLTMMQIFSFLPDAIYTILMPKAAGLTEKRKILRPLKLAIISCLAISIFIFIPLFLFRDFIIGLLFSSRYLPSVVVILPLAISQIFFMIYQFYGSTWQGLGKPGYTSVIISIAAGINLVAGYFLTKSYGIIGASVSLAISSVVAWIITVLVWGRWVKQGGLETGKIAEKEALR